MATQSTPSNENIKNVSLSWTDKKFPFDVDCISCVSLEHDPNGTRCLGCCHFKFYRDETEKYSEHIMGFWVSKNLSVTKEQYEQVMEEKERCKISGKEFDPEEYLEEIKKPKGIWGD